jgi:hypothetical protein
MNHSGTSQCTTYSPPMKVRVIQSISYMTNWYVSDAVSQSGRQSVSRLTIHLLKLRFHFPSQFLTPVPITADVYRLRIKTATFLILARNS